MNETKNDIAFSTISFSDIKTVLGHEPTVQEFEKREHERLQVEAKVDYLKNTLREMKRDSIIDSVQYRIFCEHHALNKDKVERSFSVIAKMLGIPVEIVLREYNNVRTLIANSEKVKVALGY